jgi:hypothetical protein
VEDIKLFAFLCVLFQLKHFLVDFPFQFRPTSKHGNLFLHCGLSFVMTSSIAAFFVPDLWWLGLVDGGIHLAVDYVVDNFNVFMLSSDDIDFASEEDLAQHKLFWYGLGVDQMIHHVTNIGIIYVLMGRIIG